MKQIRIFLRIILVAVIAVACTDDFDEINTNQQGFVASEVSAKFFLTSGQAQLFAPGRYEYWRAQLIHADRYAGHFSFGHSGMWFNGSSGYDYNAGWTDAVYDWLANYFGTLKSFQDLTTEGGEFENEYMYAMSLIMKGLYYQMYTETFGMVPFSEAGVDGILTPKYDTQAQIYQGIIADLDQAMATIGDTQRTGLGVNDVGVNDVYCGGDLQQWKRMANSLKLRIASRAVGAPGANFAAVAITEAMSNPLLDAGSGNVTMTKDFVISEWNSSSYGDIWWDFAANGPVAQWAVSATLVNALKDNTDPRLPQFASAAKGGTMTFEDQGTDPDFANRLNVTMSNMDKANINYTHTQSGTSHTIVMPGGQYLGQPERLHADMLPFMPLAMFSEPSETLTQIRGQQVDAYKEVIMTSAESYFLQAEAIVKGNGTGDAQAMMNAGITESMSFWGVSSGDAATYIANAALADISTGSTDEMLEKIAMQRWISAFTDGFEAWAVVRDTGYPANLAVGVSDQSIYSLGTLSGAYPQRMRYGTGAQANPNFSDAIGAQGADNQGTALWFTK